MKRIRPGRYGEHRQHMIDDHDWLRGDCRLPATPRAGDFNVAFLDFGKRHDSHHNDGVVIHEVTTNSNKLGRWCIYCGVGVDADGVVVHAQDLRAGAFPAGLRITIRGLFRTAHVWTGGWACCCGVLPAPSAEVGQNEAMLRLPYNKRCVAAWSRSRPIHAGGGMWESQ